MNNISHKPVRKLGWAVVHVMAGIPVSVKVFESKKTAILYEQRLRTEIHPDNDETGLFELMLEQANPDISLIGSN